MSAVDYIKELTEERDCLDPSRSANSIRLLEDEINKVRFENDGLGDYFAPARRSEPYKEEIVKLVEKIVMPVEEYPKFNFVGKIIGPKGSTLKGIVALTRTKISVLGRGSTRDREKEEELSQSGDSKHEHFKEPLHLVIQVEAPRSDAHQRLANAMEEINKCMTPENGDFRPEQIQDLQYNVADTYGQNFTSIHDLQAPIIRVGIPPPGAIVLKEQHGRGRGRSPLLGGRNENSWARSTAPY